MSQSVSPSWTTYSVGASGASAGACSAKAPATVALLVSGRSLEETLPAVTVNAAATRAAASRTDILDSGLLGNMGGWSSLKTFAFWP